MSPPVLPMDREGGYWLFRAGEQRFVRRAEIIPFPRNPEPQGRKVKRNGKTIWLRKGEK